jgi:HAD superfamily hydrolase (TIGR01509 family)
MKNFTFTLITFFATLQMQNIISKDHTDLSKSESIVTYMYHQKTQIPHASTTGKKNIIFDLDGVLCTTNDLQAFYEVGMKTIGKYILQELFSRYQFKTPSRKMLYDALTGAPAISTIQVYNESMLMPAIMVDWQCGIQPLETIQAIMIDHINSLSLSAIEKELLINTIMMMTNPDQLIASRRSIIEGLALLHELKDKGYNLYVVSNWDPNSFQLFQEKFPEIFIHNGKPTFNGIMTSGQTKLIKPDIAIFRHCLEKFQIPSESAIFIDDTTENIAAAQSIQIDSVLCLNKNIYQVRQDLKKHLFS